MCVYHMHAVTREARRGWWSPGSRIIDACHCHWGGQDTTWDMMEPESEGCSVKGQSLSCWAIKSWRKVLSFNWKVMLSSFIICPPLRQMIKVLRWEFKLLEVWWVGKNGQKGTDLEPMDLPWCPSSAWSLLTKELKSWFRKKMQEHLINVLNISCVLCCTHL